MKSLYSLLSTYPDHRTSAGTRFPIGAFLEMIVLAGMSGHFGINSIGRFVKNNGDFFIERYELKHGVPSQTGIYNFLLNLKYEHLNELIMSWMKQYLKKPEVKWMSIDGKAIRSTVSDKFGSKQNYQAIVSLFANDSKLVVATEKYENKKASESDVARKLIESMEIQGVTMTLDALHCQKKQRKPLWWEEMSMSSK